MAVMDFIKAIPALSSTLDRVSKAIFDGRRKRIRVDIDNLKYKKRILRLKPATTKIANKIFKINEKILRLERELIQE